tara:strand:- start:3973 stop:4206 length:234 start_codon:yes stop_codon:yes gene_type:complete
MKSSDEDLDLTTFYQLSDNQRQKLLYDALRYEKYKMVAQLAQEGVWNLHAYNLAKLMRQDQLAELILQNHPIKKNIN